MPNAWQVHSALSTSFPIQALCQDCENVPIYPFSFLFTNYANSIGYLRRNVVNIQGADARISQTSNCTPWGSPKTSNGPPPWSVSD